VYLEDMLIQTRVQLGRREFKVTGYWSGRWQDSVEVIEGAEFMGSFGEAVLNALMSAYLDGEAI
jgi:hypothetical protein